MWVEEKYIPNGDKPNTSGSFVDLACEMLKDGKINPEEVKKLISLKEKEYKKISACAKKDLAKIRATIVEALKNSTEYKEALEEIWTLSREEIKNLQRSTWAIADWLFWPDTFSNYIASDLSKIFSISQISKWMKVEDNKKFIEKFSNLSWVWEDILVTLDLKDWDFVAYDSSSWNITIYEQKKIWETYITGSRTH